MIKFVGGNLNELAGAILNICARGYATKISFSINADGVFTVDFSDGEPIREPIFSLAPDAKFLLPFSALCANPDLLGAAVWACAHPQGARPGNGMLMDELLRIAINHDKPTML
jgi:hypothetical protein